MHTVKIKGQYNFSVVIGGTEYFANAVGDTVMFQDWILSPSKGMIAAMKAIGKAAYKQGFVKMQTYVDDFEDTDEILAYIQLKSGTALWADGRMTLYEWLL